MLRLLIERWDIGRIKMAPMCSLKITGTYLCRSLSSSLEDIGMLKSYA